MVQGKAVRRGIHETCERTKGNVLARKRGRKGKRERPSRRREERKGRRERREVKERGRRLSRGSHRLVIPERKTGDVWLAEIWMCALMMEGEEEEREH